MALQDVSDDTFEADVLKASGPVVVDFWAEWCTSCKAMMPSIEAVASELGDKVKVVKLNIEESPMTAGKVGIRGVPTVMLFQDGKLAATKVGTMSKSAFHDWLMANAPSVA
jgi:thioredoxin 1